MKDAPINLPPVGEAPSLGFRKVDMVMYARAAVLADRAGREDETAWLIELPNKNGAPMFFTGDDCIGWTTANSATRFARKKDAIDIVRRLQLDKHWPEISVTEHRWNAAPSPAEPPYGPNQRWHICPGCSHQFQSRGSLEPFSQPPIDNKFVALGCEPFPQSVVDAAADVGSAAYQRIAELESEMARLKEDALDWAAACDVINSAANRYSAERNQLRALLQEAREWMNNAVGESWKVHDMVNPVLFDRIDAALKGTHNG